MDFPIDPRLIRFFFGLWKSLIRWWWMVAMNSIFPWLLGISSSRHWRSHIFQRGSNQPPTSYCSDSPRWLHDFWTENMAEHRNDVEWEALRTIGPSDRMDEASIPQRPSESCPIAFGMFINIPDRILLKIMDPPLLIIRFAIWSICSHDLPVCYNMLQCYSHMCNYFPALKNKKRVLPFFTWLFWGRVLVPRLHSLGQG